MCTGAGNRTKAHRHYDLAKKHAKPAGSETTTGNGPEPYPAARSTPPRSREHPPNGPVTPAHVSLTNWPGISARPIAVSLGATAGPAGSQPYTMAVAGRGQLVVPGIPASLAAPFLTAVHVLIGGHVQSRPPASGTAA
jgi:hypothetical protein